MDPLFIPPGAPDAKTLADTAAGLLERTGDIEQAIAYIEGFGIRLDADTKHYLRAPVLCHKSDWTADAPAFLFTQARRERIAIVLGAMPGMVGPSEITVILFAASLCAPLQREYAELYFWAAGHAMKGHQLEPHQVWEKIGVEISDADILEPRGRLNQTYKHIAQEIRSKLQSAKSASKAKRDTQSTAAVEPVAETAGSPAVPFTQGVLPL